VSHEKTEFAEFFPASWEPCLRAVVASTGSVQLAEDQVAEVHLSRAVTTLRHELSPSPAMEVD
jgi:hypothetical protein